MPQPFAAIETSLGQKAAALLADATLTSGVTVVDGILDEARGVEVDMQARRLRFVAPSGTALDALAEEATVTVTKNAVATNYKLALPPLVASGQTVIDLKRAA